MADRLRHGDRPQYHGVMRDRHMHVHAARQRLDEIHAEVVSGPFLWRKVCVLAREYDRVHRA
jgi:hypothetical protein